MHPCRVPLLRCFQTQHQHVEDDPDVDRDNQKANPIWPALQIGYLERDVDGAGGDSHPLRPGEGVPQSVGFDEAKDRVDSRHHGDLPQVYVADPVHQVDEHYDKAVVRIDMKKFQEALGYSPDIPVPHGEDTEASENDDDPFRKLNRRDGPHALDVRGIVNYRMRDYGMHLRPKILMQSETGQAPSLHEFFRPFSTLLADTGAQLLCDLQSGFVRSFALGDFERNRTHAGVSAATIAIADPG